MAKAGDVASKKSSNGQTLVKAFGKVFFFPSLDLPLIIHGLVKQKNGPTYTHPLKVHAPNHG
jgi:hypothetical protein